VRAAACGREARQLAETKYSYEAYLDRTRRVCALLTATSGPVGWAPRIEENKDAKDAM
jgi:hypothetical protein